jgi:hypothetical protein
MSRHGLHRLYWPRVAADLPTLLRRRPIFATFNGLGVHIHNALKENA